MSEIRQNYAGSDEHLLEMANLSIKRPDDYGYYGDTDLHNSWGFAGIDLSRDANCLDKANWVAFHRDIVENYPDDFTVENFGHWAVGHIDRTLVRVLKDEHGDMEIDNITDAFIETLETLEFIQECAVLDDGLLCDEEWAENIRNLEWYVEYIKENGESVIDTSGASWTEDLLSKLIDNDVELCPDAEVYASDEDIIQAAKDLGIWNDIVCK